MTQLTTAQLHAEASRLNGVPLGALAEARTGQSPLYAAGWHIDLARQHLDTPAETALLEFGHQAGLERAIADLFAGAHVNASEDRPALHWALRASQPTTGPGASVRASMDAPLAFAGDLLAARITAHDGAPFRNIVHIGIGGSDFGPRLIADAFEAERERDITLRFCANLDPLDLQLALDGLDPARTLVIGVSKSFSTEETLYNLSRARDWLSTRLGADAAANQLALVTARAERARAWLGSQDAGWVFDMPESVGGRFSLWSAAGLSCFIALGPGRIREFLAGGAEMDDHVRQAGFDENLAIRLALLDFWNTSILGYPMRVLLAYARRLRLLPAYLQQLEMESNGKSVMPDGQVVTHATAPALWGGEGSIGQHSYHQWLHQGTQVIPTEFILALDETGDAAGRRALAAHALAQAEVLANGRSLDEVLGEEPGLDPAIAAQKVHAGGRVSSFIMTEGFDARRLGALIALYEHRTFLAGQLWGVNSFDQWGVERGKTMAGRVNEALSGGAGPEDPVTARLAHRLASLGPD